MNDQSAGRAKRRWNTFSLAGLVAALGGGVMLAVQRPRLQSARLDSGTQVTLLGVSHGADLVVGSPLQRLLYAVLPPALQQHSRAEIYPSTSPTGRTYWLRWEGGGLDNHALTAFDELGNEAPATRQSLAAAGNVHAFTFEAYPRRGRIAGLRIYRNRSGTQTTFTPQSEHWYPVGELQVPNPVPPATAHWQVAAVPVAGSAGEVQVVLTRLDIGISSAEPPSFPLRPGNMLGTATVQLRQNGRSAKGWMVQPQLLSDATGNTWPVIAHRLEMQEATTHFEFSSPVWPSEDIWRLKLRLIRTNTAKFLPQETWTLNDLPVPRPGQVIPLSHRKTLLNVPREVVAIYGPGAKLPPELSSVGMGRVGTRGSCTLVVRVAGPPTDDVFAIPLAGRTDRGLPFSGWLMGYVSDARTTQEVVLVAPPPGSRKITVTLAVQRARYVELTARRNLVSAAAGSETRDLSRDAVK